MDKINARALGQKLDNDTSDVSLPHAKFIADLAESLGLWKHDDKKGAKPADEAPPVSSMTEEEREAVRA